VDLAVAPRVRAAWSIAVAMWSSLSRPVRAAWSSVPSMIRAAPAAQPKLQWLGFSLLRSALARPVQACDYRTKSRLGRPYKHRIDMLRNMVTSLIEHERIKTTEAKAKEARRLADRMVTCAKKGTLNSRRQAAKYVRSRAMLTKLFTIFKDRYAERNGGYTRVLKTYPRLGDGAPMAFLEMVERPLKYVPHPLPEQHSSVMPGRGGRKWHATRFDLRNEVVPQRKGRTGVWQLPPWQKG